MFLHDIPVANYADGNTPYCTDLKISDVLIKLENAAERLLQWFKDNRMKANPDKYHLLINNTKESYCPIVWMLHSRKLNERINHIHERALRIVYKDFNSSFQELLIENNSLNIHHKNLQKLVTEIFKVKNGL